MKSLFLVSKWFNLQLEDRKLWHYYYKREFKKNKSCLNPSIFDWKGEYKYKFISQKMTPFIFIFTQPFYSCYVPDGLKGMKTFKPYLQADAGCWLSKPEYFLFGKEAEKFGGPLKGDGKSLRFLMNDPYNLFEFIVKEYKLELNYVNYSTHILIGLPPSLEINKEYIHDNIAFVSYSVLLLSNYNLKSGIVIDCGELEETHTISIIEDQIVLKNLIIDNSKNIMSKFEEIIKFKKIEKFFNVLFLMKDTDLALELSKKLNKKKYNGIVCNSKELLIEGALKHLNEKFK